MKNNSKRKSEGLWGTEKLINEIIKIKNLIKQFNI